MLWSTPGQIHVVSIIKGDQKYIFETSSRDLSKCMIQIELIIFDAMMYALTEIEITGILVIDTILNCLGVS